jgi:hypothetical protein
MATIQSSWLTDPVNLSARQPIRAASAQKPVNSEPMISSLVGPLARGEDSCWYRGVPRQSKDASDEALDGCNNSTAHACVASFFASTIAAIWLASGIAGSYPRRRRCGHARKPRVGTFFVSRRCTHQDHRVAFHPAVPRLGHRMHPGRREHRGSDRRPQQFVRPIARRCAERRSATRAARLNPMPRLRSSAAAGHPPETTNCAPPPGRA